MTIQSQRTRKSGTTTRRPRSQSATAFQKRLTKALKALWDNTDNSGVRKGNGKQTVLIEALKVTPNQADHLNECLKHLGLLKWSGKGRGATYEVNPDLAQITPEMAANALQAVGPYPKAKAGSIKKPASKRTSRSNTPQPTCAASPDELPVALEDVDVSSLADSLPEAFALLEQATGAYAELSNRYTAEVQAHQETRLQLEKVRHDLGIAMVMVDKVTTGLDSKKIEEIMAQARLVLTPTQ